MAFTQVATIPKTAERCKAEGIGLSARQLRCLCKEGRLKHVMMEREGRRQGAGSGEVATGRAQQFLG